MRVLISVTPFALPPSVALNLLSFPGRNQRPQGEGEADHFPPQEESAVLRHFGEIELQLREAIPVAS